MIKRKFLKVLSLLVAVIMFGCLYAAMGNVSSPLILEVEAVYDSYGMTKAYRSGRYYQNLASLALTGDQSRDVIAVALSQLGYHEGDSDADFAGESAEGCRDFVEYNVLYGKLDNDQGNGLSYGYYWCASFVNWCFRQAGIPESATAGMEVSCQRWINDCKNQGIYVSKGGYIPKEGDMIFFKDIGSSVDATHIGLVLYSDGNNVYTVEGNTSNGSDYSSNGEYVALKSHSLSSSYIVGYASPKYTKNNSAHRVDRSGGFFSAGQYISTKELSLSDVSEEQSNLCQSIPVHTVFTVTDVEDNMLKVSYNGTEGYVKAGDGVVQLISTQNVFKINYLDDDGRTMYVSQYCLSGQKKSVYSNLPKREKNGFVGWSVSGSDEIILPGASLGRVTSDVTLSAVWDSNYYIVTFKDTDGKIISQAHGYYGTEYSIPETPEAPDGMEFLGWGAEIDGVITGNASYTAQFVAVEETETESESVKSEIASETASEKTTESNTNGSGCTSSIGGVAIVLSSIMGIAISLKKKK